MAIYWFEKLDGLGDKCATWELTKIYYHGHEVSEDLRKAETFANKISEWSDDDESISMIRDFATMYHYGTDGVKKNMKKAVEWYERSVILDHNDDETILTLAQIYVNGDGIPQNGKRAVELLTMIAFPHYSPLMGNVYEDGQYIPMPDDGERHLFFSDPDNFGSDEARNKLACIYFYGTAAEKNIYKAAWWFAKIDELDFYDNGEIFKLAESYRKGEGVKKDLSKAIAWYERILEYDYNDEVMYILGTIYFDNEEIENHIDQAVEFYEKSAELGNVKAMYKLGEIYRYGQGVEKNLPEAFGWIKRAFEELMKKAK